MKTIKKSVLLFISIMLTSSIASAENFNINHLTFSAAGITPLVAKNEKTNFYYGLIFDKFSSYDNGVSLGFQAKFLSSSEPESAKEESISSTKNIDIGLNVLLGYRILNSDFNLVAFSGLGVSSEAYVYLNDKHKFYSQTGTYVPFVIVGQYNLNKNLSIYKKLEYNFKFNYETAIIDFNSNNKDSTSNSTTSKISDKGHEVKFDVGLEYSILTAGLFVNYYSSPRSDKKRVSGLVYGLKAGLAL